MSDPILTVPQPGTSLDRSARRSPLVERTLVEWDRRGVRWCVLRGAVTVTGAGEDVDLLVAPDDLRLAVAIAVAAGFAPLRGVGRGSHRFLLAYDQEGDVWVKLDVVTEAAFGRYLEYPILAAASLLERRVGGPGARRLAPDDEFWALVLHCLLDKGEFADKYRRTLRELASVQPTAGGLGGAIGSLLPDRIAYCLHMAVRQGDWEQALGFAGEVRSAVRRTQPREVARRRLRNRGGRLVERPILAWERRGPRVAVLGPDGAGKSTLIHGIADNSLLPVRAVYMGLWARGREADPGLLRSMVQVLLRPFRAWGRYLTGVMHSARGRLVLFDRYTYDAMIPARPPYTWLKERYFWMLAHSCPSPDLVLVLDAPGAEMFRRKGEFDAAHLEVERRHFLSVAERVPRSVLIDATQPEDDVRREALARVWAVQSRWLGRRIRRSVAGA